MASISNKDIPAYVRRCYQAFRKANISTRAEEVERLRFYAGGDLMWRDAELQKRKASGRPWITVNRVKPPVDQIEGDVRLNPPGPQCKPVGDDPDAADPDIIEGLIREVEYRSMAEVADATAVKYCAISGYGVIELATEYCNERDDSQQLTILSVEDPHTVFFDPAARMANRQDAKWAGKIKAYSADEMKALKPNAKVLEPGGVQMARGWLADAFGIDNDMASVMEWTGARDDGDGRWRGPFYVCEFYMVEEEPTKSRKYSDKIWRYDDELVPAGVTRVPGEERTVNRRTIKKYLVDALEVHEETEWLGTLIPLFPVLGPEIYIEGKLHRLSLISPAMDSNRALNYVATTATEIAGLTTKSPWIGYKGQFDDPRWQSANSEVWAYLEVTPVYGTNEMGQQTILPPPQKNQWEAPIQWLLALGAYFSDAIKAVTSTYDASLGANKGDQSGKAIEQLRSESNVGNFSYADNLHRAKTIIYQQMCIIFPKILTGPQVINIVRPDSQHEAVAINQEFGADGIDPKTGKKGKRNNLALGQYSVRVVAGPNFQTRQQEAITLLLDAIKINPQILGNPAVAAKVVRLIGQGSPEMEGIADLLAPDPSKEATPQQMGQQLQQAQTQVQQLTQMVQQLHMEMQADLPKLRLDKYKADLDAAVKLSLAEINTKAQDEARASADALAITEIGHQGAQADSDRQHQKEQQASQQSAAAQSQTQSEQASAQAAAEQREVEPVGAE